MSSSDKIGFIVLAVVLVFIAAVIGGGIMLQNASCHAKWEDSFRPHYAVLTGCTIVIDGKRIPAVNFRTLD